MPSFADIKARAVKAKDAGVEKYQHTRDRNTSTPLKNTNWDPYSGTGPPPPPPPRVNSGNRPKPQPSFPPPPSRSTPSLAGSGSSSGPSSPPPPPSRTPSLPPRSLNPTPAPSAPPRPALPARKPSSGPPPIARSTRPDFSPRPSNQPEAQAVEEPELVIDWCNLSLEDKNAFWPFPRGFVIFDKTSVDVGAAQFKKAYRAMRRGFLKNAEKKKAPVKPAVKHTPPVGEAAVDVQSSVVSRGNVLGLESLLKSLQDLDVSGPVDIPQTRHVMRYGPNMAKFPNLRKGMRLCALPQYTKNQPVVMCLFYDGTKEAILEKPGWPAPAPYTLNPFELPYTNVDVKGMGVTTVSTKDLQAGEVIMCERPLMITPGAFPTGAHGSRPHDELVKTAVANLDPTSKYLFCSLHNCKPLEAPDYAGIIDTNTVNIGLLPGPYRGIHAAVCSAFSRINHSCIPNAMFLWDLESFTYTVRAIRPIPKGQEIFVSYFSDDYKSREERMKELRDTYKFECTCTCCTLPEAESNRSDVRREFLKLSMLGHETLYKDQDKTIKNILKLPELPILVESIVRTLGAMDEEKVYHFNTWMVHATMLSKIYCALGKREEVVELASKASIMAVVWNGNDDDWYKVAMAPEKTIWWDMAKNMEDTE